MINEKTDVTLPGWGNAKDWYNDAKKAGYTVGTTPKSNSIIVWGGCTSYGHVGYVESVKGNILYVWDSASSCIDKEDPEFVRNNNQTIILLLSICFLTMFVFCLIFKKHNKKK